LITYVGKYSIGEHGNGYKAVELILEQPKSYSAVVRTVDVFPTRLLINSVIRKGSMFRTIGSLTAEVMSHLSAA
jgi:hypothetical protein